MADTDRIRDEDETIEVVRDRRPGVPPPDAPDVPLGAPDVEQAVEVESETVRRRPDGAIERDVVREERRRRMSGDRIALLLVLLALLAAAAVGAWWYFSQSDTTTVPTVEGLTLDRAVTRLEEENLKSDIVTQENDAAEGTVFRQDPSPGTEVDEGSTVQLLVSGGPKSGPVPNAVGLPEPQARDRLVAAGFQVKSREVFAEDEPGTVVAQEPAAGADAEAGATVTINVSKGSAEVDVPNVVGMSRSEAEAEIESAKLVANAVVVPSDQPEGTVVAQNPTGGQLKQGETVRINVSQGPSSTTPTSPTDTTPTPTDTTAP
jgi:eukaryotic-like serine/threonine-protein kinase